MKPKVAFFLTLVAFFLSLCVRRALLRFGPSLFLVAALAAQGADGAWDSRFALPGIHGEVHAVATRGNEIFAGGEFTSADGGVLVSNIARWNGTNWAPMGDGLNGRVNAIVVWGTEIIAGGTFTKAGAIDANLIARWDGNVWAPVIGGTPPLESGILGAEVNALAVDDFGSLYAGGQFTEAGGVATANIALWDGFNWWALGTGVHSVPNTWVYAIATRGTHVFVGGSFTNAGGVDVASIAMWDGAEWSDVGRGVDDPVYFPQVRSLAVIGDDLFVGGGFTKAGNVTVKNIARWDGRRWWALGDGLGRFAGDIPVMDMVVNGTNLLVGGRFTAAGGISSLHLNLASWNGSSWSVVAGELTNRVNALALSAAGLLVGGNFTYTNGLRPTALARWSGTAWNVISDGSGLGLSGPGNLSAPGNRVSALVVTGSTVFVAGGFTAAGSHAVANVARWDGQDWSSLGSGLNGPVNALCQFGGELVAGGQFTVGGSSNVARWNGAQWLPLGQGIPGPVHALAADNGKLFAGGAFSAAGSIVASNLASWDGANWAPLGNGVDGTVFALAAGGGTLYAGGQFTAASGANATNIARWNGAAWTPLGGGVSGRSSTIITFAPPPVSALLLDDEDLFVGGDFANAGGVAATNLARWDGTDWFPVGDGLLGRLPLPFFAPPPAVRGFLKDGNELLVAGTFVKAGNVPAGGLAAWDGTNWSAVNPAIGPDVFAVARLGGQLFVGGGFGTIGGELANNFSILHDQSQPPPVLFISRSGSAVEIAWPGAGPSAILLSAETLSAPVWRPVTNVVVLPGGEAALVPIRTNQNEFFRLQLP